MTNATPSEALRALLQLNADRRQVEVSLADLAALPVTHDVVVKTEAPVLSGYWYAECLCGWESFGARSPLLALEVGEGHVAREVKVWGR